MKLDELFKTSPNYDVRKYVIETYRDFVFSVDGVEYILSIERLKNNTYSIEYGYNDVSGLKKFTPGASESGPAIKVLSKVVGIFKNFLIHTKPDEVEFSGSEELGLGKLYSKILTFLSNDLKNLGYSVSTSKPKDELHFHIKKNLNEIFDTKPKKFTNDTRGLHNLKRYKFEVDGEEYRIDFDKSSGKNWRVSYGYLDDYDKVSYTPKRTKDIDGKKILSYVVAYVERFIKSNKPDTISFFGDKNEGLGSLYSAMARVLNKRLETLGYTVVEHDLGGAASFVIKKNLTELFDTPHKLPKNLSTSGHKYYEFEVDGQKYFANFVHHGDNSWAYEYGLKVKGDFDSYIPPREKGNALKVLSMVTSYLLQFINSQKPYMVTFEGDDSHGLGKLYSAMAKRAAPRLDKVGYQIYSRNDDGIENFIIAPKDQEVIYGYKKV